MVCGLRIKRKGKDEIIHRHIIDRQTHKEGWGLFPGSFFMPPINILI